MLTTHRYINYTPTPGNAQELAPSRARTSEKTPKVPSAILFKDQRGWTGVGKLSKIEDQSGIRAFSLHLWRVFDESQAAFDRSGREFATNSVCACVRAWPHACYRLWKKSSLQGDAFEKSLIDPTRGSCSTGAAHSGASCDRLELLPLYQGGVPIQKLPGRCFSTRHLWFRST